MMNAVHARRHDHQIQDPFEFDRQSPVGMMKECCSLQGDKECDQHYGSNAKDQNCERKKTDRKNHLAEVKSRGRSHIEVKIGMMHIVKTPEDRHHVIGPMPPPVRVIHHEKGSDDSGPCRESEPV